MLLSYFIFSLRCDELRRRQQPDVPTGSGAESGVETGHLPEVQNPEELWDAAARRRAGRVGPQPAAGEGEATAAAQRR